MIKFGIGTHRMRTGGMATIHEIGPNGELLGILSYNGVRIPAMWDSYGYLMNAINVDHWCSEQSSLDLAREKHCVWVNLYRTDTGYMSTVYDNRESANADAYSSRLACIKLDFEEGHGL